MMSADVVYALVSSRYFYLVTTIFFYTYIFLTMNVYNYFIYGVLFVNYYNELRST